MYKCEICDSVSEPRTPKRRHYVKRGDGSILREVPVCEPCHGLIESGVPLEPLLKQKGQPLVPVPQEPKSDALPAMKPVFLSRRGRDDADR